jgi:hypothetical protein
MKDATVVPALGNTHLDEDAVESKLANLNRRGGVIMTATHVAVVLFASGMIVGCGNEGADPAGIASPQEQSVERTQPGTDDPTTTARVKSALVADAGMSAFDIEVSTADNVVTLSGTVDRDVLRDKAERTARAVKGVREVRNNLVVSAADAVGATSTAPGAGERSVNERGVIRGSKG